MAGCASPAPEDATLRGDAFGTTWTVRLRAPASDGLRERIEMVLAEVDRAMSGWRADSEVSRLNRAAATVEVSEPLAEVVEAALQVSEVSGGAFDVTVGPLLPLFGFGPGGDPDTPPPDEDTLEAARSLVGPHALEILRTAGASPRIRKSDPGVALDLSAIAKGYAVDRLAEELRAAGHAEHLVEIGGEIRVAGDWTVGIETPTPGPVRRVARSFRVADVALATSGGYRDFREAPSVPGATPRLLTHILDPRVGRPVERPQGSVTVLAPTCLEADAWATALFVLGPDAGLALADRLDLAALFLTVETDSGPLRDHPSRAFSARVRRNRGDVRDGDRLRTAFVASIRTDAAGGSTMRRRTGSALSASPSASQSPMPSPTRLVLTRQHMEAAFRSRRVEAPLSWIRAADVPFGAGPGGA